MILWSVWGEIREVLIRFDQAAFGWIDNVYQLFVNIASQEIISETVVHQIVRNMYVLVGVFALFRIAILLVNSMINPDALTKSGAGISRIFINTVIMLVLFVVTPLLFEMSRTFSNEVVKGNYIQKLFLSSTNTNAELEPGQDMQRIVVGSVLQIDSDLDDCSTSNSIGNSSCSKAKQCIEEINQAKEGSSGCWSNEKNEDGTVKGIRWNKIASYNGTRTKDANNDSVYDIDYKPLVLTVIGWVITYVLLSFTFDVAKRVAELAVLEIVSPLFIATIVDPKSIQTGPFRKWLKTLANSYVSLFLRIGIISLIILLCKLLTSSSIDLGALGKPIILIAFLIFCKQLPKWISNMIGVQDSGLGDLGIGKKIGSAALVGGLATKAGHGLAGAATGGLTAAHNQLRERRANRKMARDEAGLSRGIGKKAKAARDAWYAENRGKEQYEGMSKRAAIRAARKRAYGNEGFSKEGIKQGAKQLGASVAAGIIGGGRVGVSADNIKGAFSGSIKAANQFGQQVGFNSKGIGQKISDATDNAYIGLKGAYGSASEINNRIKAAEDAKKYSSWFSSDFRGNTPIDNVALGQKKFNEQFLGAATDSDKSVDPMFAALALQNKFKNSTISTESDGLIKVSNGDQTMKIDGKNRKILNEDGSINSSASYDYDLLVKQGGKVFGNSQEGLDNYRYMWAEMQKQAVSSTIGNNAQMSNLMQQVNNAEQSMSYNKKEATKMVSASGLVVNGQIELDGNKINLGDATMDQLKRVFLNSAAKKEDKDSMIAKAGSYSTSSDIVTQLTEQISYYMQSNKKLKNTVDSLRDKTDDSSTLEELLLKAEKVADKMEKAAKAYEVQKEEK